MGFTCHPNSVCAGGNPTQLLFNEVSYAVSGSVTLNGAPPMRSSSHCNLSPGDEVLGTVQFVDRSKNHTVTYTFTCDNTVGGFLWNLKLPAGTWEVRVGPARYGSAGVNLFRFPYVVRTQQLITGPVTNLVLDLVSMQVSGAVTVNGQPPTRSAPYCGASNGTNEALGEVRFFERSKQYALSYQFTCRNTASGFNFNLPLPAGTWEVRINPGADTVAAGVNLLELDYQATAGLVVAAPVSGLLFNETSFAVSGSVTLNGAAPTRGGVVCSSELGTVEFVDRAKNHAVTYTFTCDNTVGGFLWNLKLPAGTWEVRVGHARFLSSGVNLFPFPYLVTTQQVIAGPVNNLVLNLVSLPVAGAVTVNGQPPTRNAAYCALPGNGSDFLGSISFFERGKGYDATFGFTCANTSSGFNFNLPLAAGSWEVRINPSADTAAAGVNLLDLDYQATASQVVNAPVSGLVLDEVSYPVSGSVTLNGAPPMRSSSHCNLSPGDEVLGTVQFVDRSKNHTVTYTFTCNNTVGGFLWNLKLPAGTWEVRVGPARYRTTGVNLFPFPYVVTTQQVIASAVNNLALNLVSTQVSGAVTVNGQPPTRNAAYCAFSGNEFDDLGRISFFERSKGYGAAFGFTCASTANGFQFDLSLPAGLYEVRIRPGTDTAAAGVNVFDLDYQAVGAIQL